MEGTDVLPDEQPRRTLEVALTLSLPRFPVGPIAIATHALLLLGGTPVAAQRAPSPSDLSGVWVVAISDAEAGDRTGRLALDDRDGILSGRVEWDDGSGLAVSGWRSGLDLELRVASFSGIPLLLTGTMDTGGSEMSGAIGTEGAWLAVYDAPLPAPTARLDATASGPAAAATPADGPAAIPTGGPAVSPPVGSPAAAATPRPAEPLDPGLRLPPPATAPAPSGDPVAFAGPTGLPATEPARPRIDAPDLRGGMDQALSNLAAGTAAGVPLETAARGFASDAVEATAQEAGRLAADAVSDLASDALSRGVGGATRGVVGAGLREALDLEGATGASPLEAASQALSDVAVGLAASEARRAVADAASETLRDEVAGRVGDVAGGVIGQTLGNAVGGAGLLGGLFGRGGDSEPDEGRGPAEGLMSGRWRFVVVDSRSDPVVTHTGVLDVVENGDRVEAVARWAGPAPALLPGSTLSGERDGLRVTIRPGDAGPVLRGVVDAGARRMGGYVTAAGFVGLWQATR